MINDIRELLHREPFTPFRITLTSGQGFDVTNPDLMATGQTQLTLYYPRSDRWAILRLNQIASIEMIAAAAA
jgi:hypothetical protein